MNQLLHPRIQAGGGIVAVADAVFAPSGPQRVVFNLTKAASDATHTNPGLERTARLLNLYAYAGIDNGDVEVICVAAGEAVAALVDAPDNPNAELVEELLAQRVRVAVCGQAWLQRENTNSQLLPGVEVALSALTTIAQLQREGYALIPI